MKILIELEVNTDNKELATRLMYRAVDAAQEPIRQQLLLVRTGYGLIQEKEHE